MATKRNAYSRSNKTRKTVTTSDMDTRYGYQGAKVQRMADFGKGVKFDENAIFGQSKSLI
jgi:hypothetical protein